MKVDPDDLTFREILDIEDKAGVDFADVLSGEKRSMRALAAVVWVVRRREQPDYTWDDALGESYSTTRDVFEDAPAEDPTEAAAGTDTTT